MHRPGLHDLIVAPGCDNDAAAADRFRELYAEVGVPGTALLPGASESVAAVADLGGRSIVVTSKFERNALACLEHVGLVVDRVYGWRHGPGKGVTLTEESASIYVGDTPSDVIGARAADALAVGVATGPHSPRELRDAVADVVLSSLLEFPALLRARGGSR